MAVCATALDSLNKCQVLTKKTMAKKGTCLVDNSYKIAWGRWVSQLIYASDSEYFKHIFTNILFLLIH